MPLSYLIHPDPETARVCVRIHEQEITAEQSYALAQALARSAAVVRLQARDGSEEDLVRAWGVNDHIHTAMDAISIFMGSHEVFQEDADGVLKYEAVKSPRQMLKLAEETFACVHDSLVRILRILLAQPPSAAIHMAVEQPRRDHTCPAETARRIAARVQAMVDDTTIPAKARQAVGKLGMCVEELLKYLRGRIL
jgi:hypothetical protein